MTKREKEDIFPLLISATPTIIMNTTTLQNIFCFKRLNLNLRNSLEDRIFICGRNRFYVFQSGARLEANHHYLEIQSIESKSKNMVF